MTKKLFILCMALMWTAALMAQNIAVVNGNNTDLYRTLAEAIEGATSGSVIYLPGGGFPISDDVKITKKLTIIGVGHKSNNDNVDGVTTISGNLWFNEGSSGSAVMGCFITGDVNIGDGSATVNEILIKFCNLSNVYVRNSTCMGTIVNQNYIRGYCSFHGANGSITYNIINRSVEGVNGCTISNNIIVDRYYYQFTFNAIYNSIIMQNIVMKKGSDWGYYRSGNDNQISNNMCTEDWGDDPINVGNVNWDDVFVNYNGGVISSVSDFHFKEAYKQYEGKVGVYANGTDFDKQLVPVPYIIAKDVKEQTDASGRLNVKFRVKAGE